MIQTILKMVDDIKCSFKSDREKFMYYRYNYMGTTEECHKKIENML
jgi:hypothetical protein